MPDRTELAEFQRAAIAEHTCAVLRWLASSREERAGAWYDVEAAWRKVKSLRADTEASHRAAALMRADGKLRSIS